MRAKKFQPWLDTAGVELPTEKLKEICKGWTRATWDEYLNWYESSRREALVTPHIYKKLGEEISDSIFVQFSQDTSLKNRLRCEHLLSTIPGKEARILILTFFFGRTEREIAALERMSKSGVHDMKNRALTRLRRGQDGSVSGTRRFMRGEISKIRNSKKSIWDRSSSYKIKEAREYDPKNQEKEFANIEWLSLRMALLTLSERQRRILYLRYWCEFTYGAIARDLRCGVNVVDQVGDAAVSKLKRTVFKYETGYEPGEFPEGGFPCV